MTLKEGEEGEREKRRGGGRERKKRKVREEGERN